MNDMKIPVADYENLAPSSTRRNSTRSSGPKIAKDAGMKYVVITTNTTTASACSTRKVGNYDVIESTPFKRDVMKELADAVRGEGMTMCWYHSIMDWHHADAQTKKRFPIYFEHYLKPQVKRS
jgi:alpha-L-fucosidase